MRRNVMSSPAIGCASHKSVVTVSYYIVYLPKGGGSRTLTVFKSARSGATTSQRIASLGLIRGAVSNVYCYSSEDRSENEDQMEKVIVDVEMFMTRNKQALALKYRKSESLPWKSIFCLKCCTYTFCFQSGFPDVGGH